MTLKSEKQRSKGRKNGKKCRFSVFFMPKRVKDRANANIRKYE